MVVGERPHLDIVRFHDMQNGVIHYVYLALEAMRKL